MTNKKLYFWYSQKQQKMLKGATLVKLDNGTLTQYTECNETKSPLSQWEDLKYLGIGRIYSVGETLYGEFRK